MNPLHYLYLFLRYSWLIILIAAVALAGTWAWLSKQEPVYASRAVMQVDTEEAKIVKIDDLQDNKVTSLDQLNTVVQTLSSNKVTLAVAKALGITVDEPAASPGGASKLTSESALAGKVSDMLKISLRRNTRLIDIVAEEKDPVKAQKLADEVVNQFLILQGQGRTDVSKDAFTFLKTQSEELKKKSEDSDKALADYRFQHNAVSLDKNADIVTERLNDLNKQVTAANGQRTALESDLNALEKIPPGNVQEMLKLASVTNLPNVAQLRTALTESEANFAEIKERYLYKHPKYGAAQGKLQESSEKLKAAVSSAGDTLRQQYRSFTESEKALAKLLDQAKAEALEMDKVAFPYNSLKREAEMNRSLYESVLNRMKETDITSNITKTPYRVIEEPLANPVPVRPNPPKMMAAAGVLAFLLGCGLVLLIDHMDSTIRTVDEAENTFGLGVLAAVPEGDVSKVQKGGTVMTDDANSSQAEAFRTLRASISLLGEEDKRRIILVTSAIPAEGKTFTSTNLAASFATQGYKTLLIDADLRRPALSASMLERDVRQNEDVRGLTDVLSGLCPLDEAIRTTKVPNLSLIPSGRRAPNPAELLSQGGVEKLLEELSGKFDRIILDSAPINAVSDSLAVAPLAHAVCLVLRYGKTPRRATSRALALLKKSGSRMAGVIMNRMPSRRGAAYYYYYYGDPYVKDGVYGSEVSKKKRGRKPTDELQDDAPLPVTSVSQTRK